MPRLSDVIDPMIRAALEEAEHSLDAGEYTDTVRRCADVYLRLVEAQPELAPSSVDARGRLPTVGGGLSAAALPGRARQPTLRPWPELTGVAIRFDDDKKPQMEFDKERFTMSDALTCFEYTLDTAVLGQKLAAS